METVVDEYRADPFVGHTWQQTSGLRWRGPVLEQAWQCIETGEIEWREVPRVSE